MPTYQYRCRECGHDLEVVQAFTDDALTECPQCGGSLRKVFSAVGISFKGSGFYKTDTRSGSAGSSASGAGSSSSESSTTTPSSDGGSSTSTTSTTPSSSSTGTS
ncbi:MAG: FmdB family zinc ribbon protein [Acidimicrobiales bacterium]